MDISRNIKFRLITFYTLIWVSINSFSQMTTALPFGPKISKIDQLCKKETGFYYNIIGQNTGSENFKRSKSYKLPEIKSVVFVKVDTINDDDMDPHSNNGGVDTLFKYYKKKLPNLGKYEIYYDSNINQTSPNLNSWPVSYEYYGILILYERKLKKATVLPIFYHRYIDALVIRNFYINTNYEIFVCHQMYTDVDDATSGSLFKIDINQNDIKIVQLHEYTWR